MGICTTCCGEKKNFDVETTKKIGVPTSIDKMSSGVSKFNESMEPEEEQSIEDHNSNSDEIKQLNSKIVSEDTNLKSQQDILQKQKEDEEKYDLLIQQLQQQYQNYISISEANNLNSQETYQKLISDANNITTKDQKDETNELEQQ